MSSTRTGDITIGFRLPFGAWAKDLNGAISFATDSGFGALDINRATPQAVAAIKAAGLRVGSVDMPTFGSYIVPDADARREAAELAAAYVREVAADGGLNFFSVFLPPDPQAARRDNFGYLIEGLKPIVAALEETGSRMVVEGYPGPGALCCTPESYRALFAQIPSTALAVNYDPSHLIRMHIDPLRFLREFVGRVAHVHGKDTAIDTDAVYEYGTEQPPTFAKGPAFGTVTWRYCIPGHGIMDWVAAFKILAAADYAGCVSIELEDMHFNGTEAGDKAGLIHGYNYLKSC